MEVDGSQDVTDFDLESYISSYTSHTKIDRLEFIADKCQGTPLEAEALRMAEAELKQSENTARYCQLMEKAKQRLGQGWEIDQAWVDEKDGKARRVLERLESLLAGYKSNLVKESIRMGHNDLGDFHYNRGELQTAFKWYVRARDYCTTPQHILALCLNAIKTAIELGNNMHASNYLQKADQTPDVEQDSVVFGKLRCAAGLVALKSGRYKQAALKFVEVLPDLGSQYSDMIAPSDIATYGALCALATFDRDELKQKVIHNISFTEFLELTPEVREILHDFYNSRYTSCLRQLSAIRPQLSLDMHLHKHVQFLYDAIRKHALVQYTAPFSSMDLQMMAGAFNTTVEALEKELVALIVGDKIHARIDSQRKLLYARRSNARAATFNKVLSVGEAYDQDARAALLRASLRKHDFVLRPNVGPRQPSYWEGEDN
mmetsp:Transcript_5808/g.14103  ORF Transcript_5808/g.14103 Transcript_5808/m.14103 type:complete len:431 (-) Transcript_5808:288-1580(-)